MSEPPAATGDAAPGAAAPGPDGLLRCPWALGTADYLPYHDQEWGRPVRSDAGIFERLSLEAFQSGLSWLTILRKRENFRAAFGGFDPQTVAGFGPADEARLLADAGIVRNRAKIRAVLGNARAALAVPGGLAAWYGGTRRRRGCPPSPWRMCPPRRLPPGRAPVSCGNWGSPSSALSPSTPHCKPVAWWTTTSWVAFAVASAHGACQTED